MKKLIQISPSINTGSIGNIAEHIGELASNEGWSCYIAHSHRYSRPSSLCDISTSKGVNEGIHYLGAFFSDGEGRFSKSDTRRLIAQMRRISPDIIHLHNIHGHYLNYPLLFDYLKEANVPVVWTLHDCWPFTGHCVHFDSIGCNKWRTECRGCALTREYPTAILDRSRHNFNCKKASFGSLERLTLVPVSDWLGGLLSDSFLSKYPKRVIHNGIDLTVFSPKSNASEHLHSYNVQLDKKIVLGVANGFDKRKGLLDLIALAEELGDGYQIVLVGVKKNINAPGIISVRRTNNQEELAYFYSCASVFVNPTYEDNFPTTNMEALACGTPVITYRTGGSPEAIDASTGIVVDCGDIKSLAIAIRKICSRDKQCFIDSCRNRAVANFEKNERFRDYIDLYEGLLQSSKKTDN